MSNAPLFQEKWEEGRGGGGGGVAFFIVRNKKMKSVAKADRLPIKAECHRDNGDLLSRTPLPSPHPTPPHTISPGATDLVWEGRGKTLSRVTHISDRFITPVCTGRTWVPLPAPLPEILPRPVPFRPVPVTRGQDGTSHTMPASSRCSVAADDIINVCRARIPYMHLSVLLFFHLIHQIKVEKIKQKYFFFFFQWKQAELSSKKKTRKE